MYEKIMLSTTAICLLIVVHSFFQFVLSLQFLSQPQESHHVNVNVKGDGFFFINKVGDSEIPNPASARPYLPDKKRVVITVDQHSNYLENLYAMEKKTRDKRILEDLKQIIKQSGRILKKSGRVRKED
uniref:Uncharacterized protein n=1 Tax=Cacopsylla melanoneura TaxID=428564 RepID=A0A8D9E9W8_9HEMI